ncbi:MAG TPA: S41 family peptidase [Mollicutes bacterium]|nr:S41 family peptidase [Mollicutes bacterium]
MDSNKKTNTVKQKVKKILKKDNKRKPKAKFLGFKLFEVIVLISLATIIGVFSGSFFTYLFMNNRVPKVNSSKYIDEFEEAFNNVIDKYYEKVDKSELIDAAINGMLSELDDYTSYMTPEQTKSFNERMEGEYKGIGIEFITTALNEHFVTGVFEDTPAQKAGIKVGDQIVKVDNLNVSQLTGDGIANYIKGENIKKVDVTVKRGDKEITLTIDKTVVTLPSIIKKSFESNGKKIGYIGVSLFANNTYNQFKKALNELENEKVSSLIIDLRDNSGGYLHVTENMLELFMKKGSPLYQTKEKNVTKTYYDETTEKRDIPVALLINQGSASASEVLASAFKEVYKAEIIGKTSFGKGTVQQPKEISNGGMLKITTSEWLTALGNTINKVGVKPTIEVEIGNDYLNNPSDENDMQLQKAIEILSK